MDSFTILELSIKETLKKREELIQKIEVAISSTIEQFILNTISEIRNEYKDFSQVNEDSLNTIESRIKKTKYRWVKKEIEEGMGLNIDIEIVARNIYENYGKEKFELIYEVSSIEKLRELKIEELKNWAKDRDKLLIDYLYLDSKSKYQVSTALANDIKLLAINLILEKKQSQKHSYIAKLPHVMSNVPYDATNKGTLSLDEIKDNDGNIVRYVNRYMIDDEKTFESLVDAKALKYDFMGGMISALNGNDFSIFLYLISRADNDFYLSREIIVPIRDIVLHRYGDNDSIGSYMSVRDSLFKMQHLTIGVVDSSLRGFTLKLIDNIDIYKADNKEMVRVIVNIDIVEQIVENNTINMYEDVINNFKLQASRILIFRLQRERIALTLKNDEPLRKEVGMNFFRGVLYFSDKKKYRNIKLVENALDEIVSNNITLKGYERIGDRFMLEFLPITKKERDDLLMSPKKLN